MLTFQTERWLDCLFELEKHWQAHWEEVALDREHIALAPDYESYALLAQHDMLHVTTARADGQLVGYVVAILKKHLHYRETLYAHWDLYYLAPSHRLWLNCSGMFAAAVEAMKERGVKKHVAGTKRSKDISAIFKRLGWRETETIFTLFTGES